MIKPSLTICLIVNLTIVHQSNTSGRWAISYCTKHPGKDAVGACCQCGQLVCKACYTELNEKVYCVSCANKLFTLKTPEPAKPPLQGAARNTKPPEAAPKIPEPVKPTIPTTPAQKMEPPQVKPIAAPAPEPATHLVNVQQPEPAAKQVEAIEPVKQPEPAVVPPPKAADQPKEIKVSNPKQVKVTAPGNSITKYIWWLAPVLLACFGGLLAWLMTRSKDAQKAKMMLWTGLGLTVAYAAVIALIILLPGKQSAQGTIIYAKARDGSYQIDIMRPDGSNASILTVADNVNKYYNVQPSWCAATQKIVFYTNRDGNAEIYSMNADTSGQVNLTNNNYFDAVPDWSPDGKKIAFSSNRDGNSEIYTMDADGSDLQRLTISKPVDDRPKWSPDGKKILFYTDRDGNNEIYVMDADGSNQQRLTTNESSDYAPRWSPDGKKIVFTSERDGNPEVYLMDATGSNQKRLTFNSAKDYGPCFSPDGSRIVYYSNTDGNNQIYVMNTEGGNQIRLTNNKDDNQSPLWISETLKGPDSKTPPPIAIKLCGGSDNVANYKYASGEDQVHYVKLTPDKNGTISLIKVYSTKTGNAKAAIYESDVKTDMPGKKLNSSESPTVCAANQWNNISIPPTPVKSGTTYWLAYNSDTTGVVMIGPGTSKLVYKKATFENYTFPDTAETGMTNVAYDVSTAGWGFLTEQDSK